MEELTSIEGFDDNLSNELITRAKAHLEKIRKENLENLKNLEIKGNFNENAYQAPGKKITFFHLGPKNNWKKLLDNKITRELELKLENEMKELGYL